HYVIEVRVRHFRLDHPEFGEMPARLRLLGSERRAEAVHVAERHRVRLVVQLAALRQVGGRIVEVLDRKERGRPFARGGRKYWRIREDEAARVEEVADGVDDLVADPENRLLAWRSNPQVPALEQVVGAVLLGRDRVVVRFGDNLELRDVELISARGTRVGADRAVHDDGAFLRQV